MIEIKKSISVLFTGMGVVSLIAFFSFVDPGIATDTEYKSSMHDVSGLQEAPLFGQEMEIPVEFNGEGCGENITPNGDADGDGQGDEGKDDRLVSTEEDEAGNKVELWCLNRKSNPANGDNPGGFQFGLKYIPKTGDPIWIGRCKFCGGKNAGVKTTDDGVFKKIVWKNRSTKEVDEGGKEIEHRDQWEYNVGGNLKATPQKRDFGKSEDYDTGWGPDASHNTKEGPPPTTFKKLIEDFSTGTTRLLASLQDTCESCQDSIGLYFYGLAEGGVCSLYVFEVGVGISTSLSQSPDSIAAEFENAINADTTLANIGIGALAQANRLRIAGVGGDNLRIIILDPGIRVTSSIEPPTIVELSSTLAGNDIYLWWTKPYSEVGIIYYVVYRSMAVYSSGDSIASPVDTFYIDIGAAGNAAVNYFYTVTAVDSLGRKSAKSNIVGEFDRNLITAR